MSGPTALLSGILALILLLYFLLAPAGIDPRPWDPPEDSGLTGPYKPNNDLLNAEIIARGRLRGPEDVARSRKGLLYAGLANGDIVQIDKEENVQTLVNTGGRPLGLHFDPQGRLIIADAHQGLLRLTLPTHLEVLTQQNEDVTINFADDVTVGRDGAIYFTDASARWDLDQYRRDALESQPSGKLIRYNPETRHSEVLMEDLFFANGVALAADESFVLVNETWGYRVSRLWLTGERAGEREVFLENLPGFPDGISTDRNGHFWIALVAPRNQVLDAIHPYPFLKRLSVKLPPFLQPEPQAYGLIARYDAEGNLISQHQDPGGYHVYGVTSVQDSPAGLLLGTLDGNRLARLDFPPP